MRFIALFMLLTVTVAQAAGADTRLLNMVMPDAQVMAGVNVQQAKTTPFGQWVLNQMQSQDRHMQQMSEQVNFDPRRDVTELLIASPGGNDPKTGLALAVGTFDVARISAAAQASGATVETYRGATLITDPKKQGSFAFPDSAIVVAGTPEQVRAALDRRNTTTASIAPALATKVNQLSTTQDAWAITLVPPSSLQRAGRTPQVGNLQQADVFQKIQQAEGGVKFGSNIVVTAQALASTAQDASAMAGVLQFLANMALTQAQNDPNAAALVKSLTVNAQGQAVNVGLTLPHAQFEQLVQPRQRSTVRKRPSKQ